MIKAIDLFAGAGGLSYGFKMAGDFHFVAAAEINKAAQKTYLKNIVDDSEHFEMIDNVIGFDFDALNNRLGPIDVVIGGPPCQGFSNANRQKSKLISTNNSLVKEYFRAIKEIRPKVFVMENVSMLKSSTHRFYESVHDQAVVDALQIPKRPDSILLSRDQFEGIALENPVELLEQDIILPLELAHLLNVLKKNLHNSRRLPNFINNHGVVIINQIKEFVPDDFERYTEARNCLNLQLIQIKDALEARSPADAEAALIYVVGLQKLLASIQEIQDNGLIGEYHYSEDGGLVFSTSSYSVIDYINAVLGKDYEQKSDTINAEWFGVPQERRRHIIIGVRKDIYNQNGIRLQFPNRGRTAINTVGDALNDLADYEVGYESDYPAIKYRKQEELSSYACKMRQGSTTVKNHITAKTGAIAMERFKKIGQGENFHILSEADKETYSNPKRTQNTIYFRLDPTSPSKTVVNVRKSMWIHPTLDRAITVREAARLQSFPDKFEFVGSKDSQYQQVGNAVPPLLARRIAMVVLRYLQ